MDHVCIYCIFFRLPKSLLVSFVIRVTDISRPSSPLLLVGDDAS